MSIQLHMQVTLHLVNEHTDDQQELGFFSNAPILEPHILDWEFGRRAPLWGDDIIIIIIIIIPNGSHNNSTTERSFSWSFLCRAAWPL